MLTVHKVLAAVTQGAGLVEDLRIDDRDGSGRFVHVQANSLQSVAHFYFIFAFFRQG